MDASTSHVNFATTSMYSLLDFYTQQQSWVTSQLVQPSPSVMPSLTSYDASPSPAPSVSSTLSVSSCYTRSSSSTIRSSASSKNRCRFISPAQRRRGPVRNTRNAPKWARRHLPSLHRITNTPSRIHKSRPVTRIALRMRTIALRRKQPTQMIAATTTPPPERPATPAPLSLPRAPSPEATDLLVRYQLMIGDRMESCMRLQSMINEAYGGPQRV